jgi:hypothetical protein
MDNGEYSLSQLMSLVNLKDLRSFTLNYLNPALEINVIVLTHPEQKNHRDQKYKKWLGTNRKVPSHYCVRGY